VAELIYRPAELDDAALASDLMTSAYPALAQDPVLTRYRWEQPRRDYSYGRFIAEKNGRPIAYLGWIHGPWDKLPDRHCEVEVWLDQEVLDHELLKTLWSWAGDQAEAEGSGQLLAYAAEDEKEMLNVLATLGYERDRVEKVWELDLRTQGGGLVAQAKDARERMAGAGIRFATVAESRDPVLLQKLHALTNVTIQDVPHTLPILDETYEDFERRMNAPDRPRDRFWVAYDGDRPVALSYLKFPPVRGTVWTGYTCSHPEYRGRGLARGVKLQSLAQAVELGMPLVCTDNDAENAPMLHINEKLGYRPRPGFVSHLKRVDKKPDG
jgi:RimJ/RimL family protein N-acetyltransferase